VRAPKEFSPTWGGGVYSPKWTSTTYTLLHLLWLGLPPRHPAALRGCERLWVWQARWRVPETCVVSILVRLTSYHGYEAAHLDDLVAYLIDQQLADGGWNCATRTDKTKHSSFHTSIQALEALDAYTSAGGPLDASESLRRGHGSSSTIGCTSHTAPEQSPSAAAPGSPPSPNGISTCSAASSTSGSPVHPATNGCTKPSRWYDAHVAVTVDGTPTPRTQDGIGSSSSPRRELVEHLPCTARPALVGRMKRGCRVHRPVSHLPEAGSTMPA
jgi:hypothetical protein